MPEVLGFISNPEILTLYSHSYHTALLSSLVACCALVEPRGGHGEILQQHSAGVVVIYTSRKQNGKSPPRQGLYCLLSCITDNAKWDEMTEKILF